MTLVTVTFFTNGGNCLSVSAWRAAAMLSVLLAEQLYLPPPGQMAPLSAMLFSFLPSVSQAPVPDSSSPYIHVLAAVRWLRRETGNLPLDFLNLRPVVCHHRSETGDT
jgi:hypothetical protein